MADSQILKVSGKSHATNSNLSFRHIIALLHLLLHVWIFLHLFTTKIHYFYKTKDHALEDNEVKTFRELDELFVKLLGTNVIKHKTQYGITGRCPGVAGQENSHGLSERQRILPLSDKSLRIPSVHCDCPKNDHRLSNSAQQQSIHNLLKTVSRGLNCPISAWAVGKSLFDR